jgi:hypothetical protein
VTQDDNAKAQYFIGVREASASSVASATSVATNSVSTSVARVNTGTSCRCVWALEPSDSHWSIYRDLLRTREEEEDGGPQCA